MVRFFFGPTHPKRLGFQTLRCTMYLPESSSKRSTTPTSSFSSTLLLRQRAPDTGGTQRCFRIAMEIGWNWPIFISVFTMFDLSLPFKQMVILNGYARRRRGWERQNHNFSTLFLTISPRFEQAETARELLHLTWPSHGYDPEIIQYPFPRIPWHHFIPWHHYPYKNHYICRLSHP